MRYTTLLIDLDETVYPASCGVWEAISDRMEQFMHERLHIPPADIPAMRKAFFNQYGTTLRGLQTVYHVDEHEFVEFVHDVPLARFIEPDPLLRKMLLGYRQRKMIFTNADRNHAGRVIRQIGLEDCFEGIIDILDLSPYCKPMPESFEIALRAAGEPDPRRCIFIDDSPSNLAAGREAGFYTIQVGEPKAEFQHLNARPPARTRPHARITYLHELPSILDPLLNDRSGDR